MKMSIEINKDKPVVTVNELVEGVNIGGKVYHILSSRGKPLRAWAIARRCKRSVWQVQGFELCNDIAGLPDFHNDDGTLGCFKRGGAWFITHEAVVNTFKWYKASLIPGNMSYDTYPKNGKTSSGKVEVSINVRIDE